ncbi:MAG: Dps family protein [Reichenbachiella sp.]|uniref:Dps family protein n=1 Tax=Reichenbachiella sp. TaxID=2184521 RepID=UPI0032977BED
MKENKEIIEKLNNLLADFQIYYQNLRGFHWNIQGKEFFELHVKFEELYTDAAMKVDEIAERILTVGGTPLHSFEDYLATAQIKPVKNIHNGETSVKTVVANLEQIVKQEKELKEIAGEASDSGTEDQMSALIEEQEKTLWMYKAWLK